MNMRRIIAAAVIAGVALTSVAFAQEQQGARQGQGRAGGGRTGGAAATPAFKTLTRAEFDALVKEPGKLLVIDVRRPDEISTNGGFPVYLSIQLADLDKYADYIPKDRTLVAVSNHASRGVRAAALLAAKGFNVAGGYGAQDYEADGGTFHLKVPVPAPREGGAGTASGAGSAAGAPAAR